jgi:hypothetical protein
MLGVTSILIMVLAMVVGVEIASPGTLPAVIRTTVTVSRAAQTGVAASLCDGLVARGEALTCTVDSGAPSPS